MSESHEQRNTILGEFTNYADYKKDFFSFQQKLEQNLPILPTLRKSEMITLTAEAMA